jgi:hypothetical protein
MKLEQGQIWKQGDHYLRIVTWERMYIEYKIMKDPVSKEGTFHQVTKKEFCRMLKGAVLQKPEKKPTLIVSPPGEKDEIGMTHDEQGALSSLEPMPISNGV